MKCLICACTLDPGKNEIHSSLYQCLFALSKRIKALEDQRPDDPQPYGMPTPWK